MRDFLSHFSYHLPHFYDVTRIKSGADWASSKNMIQLKNLLKNTKNSKKTHICKTPCYYCLCYVTVFQFVMNVAPCYKC